MDGAVRQFDPPSFTAYHTKFPGGVRWRMTEDGVDIEGSGIERTPGAPLTVTRVWGKYGGAINRCCGILGVPCELVLATICTESDGDPSSLREEPGFVSDAETPGSVSAGLMQTLLSTAAYTLRNAPDAPSVVTREWLFVPDNSIRVGTAFIKSQLRSTLFDPPLVAAAYNAGGIYEQKGAQNRWRLRQFPIGTSAHVDRFVKWFNDFVAAVRGADLLPRPVAVQTPGLASIILSRK